MKTYRKVLTIAGTDSGGGAGIPADIKTISACGCYAECVVTAVTVQNTLGVTGVHDIPPEIIKAQIDSVMTDLDADAIKIGMLSTAETVDAVAISLEKYHNKTIVLDTVMVSTSGHTLLLPDAVETLKNKLMPLANIITPNIPEAEILLGKKIDNADQLEDCARQLSLVGDNSVLLKAGHLEGVSTLSDVLYNVATGQISHYQSEKISTPNTHGTGCTLSSAIAAYMAQGKTIEEAVATAHNYLHTAIKTGAEYKIGHGHGPVKHFWNFW